MSEVYEIAYLARMYWEMGNIEKVEHYMKLGDDICRKYPKAKKQISVRTFSEAKTEIEDEMKCGASGAEFF